MHSNSPKVRLSVDCTEEERMFIKMLAAKNRMTISDYLLSFARKQMPAVSIENPIPNHETERVLKNARHEKGEIFSSLDEFWNAMGMHPDVPN